MSHFTAMALLPAIGLGVAIIVLRILAPEIWSALEHLVLSALSLASDLTGHLQAAVGTMTLPPPNL